MQKAVFIFTFAILMLIDGIAFAQSATPITIGTQSITGCPSSITPCWIPVSTSAPLPATLVIKP